jgi:glucose/mannose transport system substrate-binding protein
MNAVRAWKHLALASLLVGAAACGGHGASSSPVAGAGEVELFTWWTTGGNAAAVADETRAFQAQYPGVSFVRGFASGGGGTYARALLVERMAENNPPDVFQTHGGLDLLGTWVRPSGVPDHSQNRMEDLSPLFASEGWSSLYFPTILQTVRDQGGTYGLPLSVHKENGVFYNKKIFQQYGFVPPTTLDDFHVLCDALEAKDIIPITVGLKDPFSITMIFSDVLLSTANKAHPGAGAQWVSDYWAGKQTDDSIVVQAVQELASLVSYMNPDRATLSYAQASTKLDDGSAAMMMMGDWMVGLLTSSPPGGHGLTQLVDFDLMPFPGTADTFVEVIDAWGVPMGIPPQDRANAIEYLRIAGSKDVSTKFSIDKNCIPPRKDVDTSLLGPLGQRAVTEYSSLHILPSMANGVAAPVAYSNAVQGALFQFMGDGDTSGLITALRTNYPLTKQ